MEAGEEQPFPIDRLKHICRATSVKAGGLRYTVMISGWGTYLFHEFSEDEGRWSIEIPIIQSRKEMGNGMKEELRTVYRAVSARLPEQSLVVDPIIFDSHENAFLLRADGEGMRGRRSILATI